jgi:hypothetical protein
MNREVQTVESRRRLLTIAVAVASCAVQSFLGAQQFCNRQEIPHIYGIRMFVTVFTTARHLFFPEPDKSSPHHPVLFLVSLQLHPPICA